MANRRHRKCPQWVESRHQDEITVLKACIRAFVENACLPWHRLLWSHATAREGDEVEEVEDPPNSLVQGYRGRLFGKVNLVNFRGLVMTGLTRQSPSLLPSTRRRIPAEGRDGGGGL